MESLSAVLLAGGFGSRIKYIFPNFSKPLIPVFDIPIIIFLLNQLYFFNIVSFLVSITESCKRINTFLKKYLKYFKINYIFDLNSSGTWGGLINNRLIYKKYLIILNSDSFFNSNLNKFYIKNIFIKKITSLKLKKYCLPKKSLYFRYGGVIPSTFKKNILNFFEKKSPSQKLYFNGGIYFIQTDYLSKLIYKNIRYVRYKSISIENWLLPLKLLNHLKLNYNWSFNDFFIDIGLPCDFKNLKFW